MTGVLVPLTQLLTRVPGATFLQRLMHDGRVRVMTYDLQAVCICTLLFFIKLNVGRVLHNTKSIELNVSPNTCLFAWRF